MHLHWNISPSLTHTHRHTYTHTHTHTLFSSFSEELLLLLLLVGALKRQLACAMVPAAETSPLVIHAFNHSGSPTSHQRWRGLTQLCLLGALAPFVLFRTLSLPSETMRYLEEQCCVQSWSNTARVELVWSVVRGHPRLTGCIEHLLIWPRHWGIGDTGETLIDACLCGYPAFNSCPLAFPPLHSSWS